MNLHYFEMSGNSKNVRPSFAKSSEISLNVLFSQSKTPPYSVSYDIKQRKDVIIDFFERMKTAFSAVLSEKLLKQ